MPHTASFLMSNTAKFGREKRADSYSEQGKLFQYVVWAEIEAGKFYELDAEDLDHAKALAEAWVDKHHAWACSVRAVNRDGTIARNPFLLISPEPPEGFWDDWENQSAA